MGLIVRVVGNPSMRSRCLDGQGGPISRDQETGDPSIDKSLLLMAHGAFKGNQTYFISCLQGESDNLYSHPAPGTVVTVPGPQAVLSANVLVVRSPRPPTIAGMCGLTPSGGPGLSTVVVDRPEIIF